MDSADAPQMSSRHAALAKRVEPLLEPDEAVLYVFGGRVTTGSAWWAVAVLGPALLFRVLGAPWWLTVGWLAVGLVLVLSLATDWWTIAVTDTAIVVLRNSKMAFRREPSSVVKRLTYEAWPGQWTKAGGLSLAGKNIDLVPTDRSQVKAADAAIRRWRSGV